LAVVLEIRRGEAGAEPEWDREGRKIRAMAVSIKKKKKKKKMFK